MTVKMHDQIVDIDHIGNAAYGFLDILHQFFRRTFAKQIIDAFFRDLKSRESDETGHDDANHAIQIYDAKTLTNEGQNHRAGR